MYWEGVVLAFLEAHLMVLVSHASFERRVVKIVEDNPAPVQAEKRVDNWHQQKEENCYSEVGDYFQGMNFQEEEGMR